MSASDDDEVPQLVAEEDAAQLVQQHAQQPVKPSEPAAVEPSAAAAAPAPPAYVRDPNDPPVPIAILTGWLGAGKTTLLTRILAYFTSRGESIAILQNEASTFGVEAGLALQDDSGAFSQMIELGGGCVCCSVKSDFVLGVETLLKRQRFAYILLECSGLADPGPLASLFWVDAELESAVYLDGIISLVDARHFPRHLASLHELESAQVVHQIAYADRIILNKMDLVTEQERDACIEQIRRINQAPILCTTKSDVEFDKILNIHAFDVNDMSRSMPSLEPATADSTSTTTSAVAAHPHDSTITTFMCDDLDVSPNERRQVDLDRLKAWLIDLLWQDAIDSEADQAARAALAGKSDTAAAAAAPTENTSTSTSPSPTASAVSVAGGATFAIRGVNTTEIKSQRPNEIFRLKAILNVQGDSYPTFLQGVQQLYDLQPGVDQKWPEIKGQPEATPFTRFVFIGRRLDRDILRAGYQSIFV